MHVLFLFLRSSKPIKSCYFLVKTDLNWLPLGRILKAESWYMLRHNFASIYSKIIMIKSNTIIFEEKQGIFIFFNDFDLPDFKAKITFMWQNIKNNHKTVIHKTYNFLKNNEFLSRKNQKKCSFFGEENF